MGPGPAGTGGFRPLESKERQDSTKGRDPDSRPTLPDGVHGYRRRVRFDCLSDAGGENMGGSNSVLWTLLHGPYIPSVSSPKGTLPCCGLEKTTEGDPRSDRHPYSPLPSRGVWVYL